MLFDAIFDPVFDIERVVGVSRVVRGIDTTPASSRSAYHRRVDMDLSHRTKSSLPLVQDNDDSSAYQLVFLNTLLSCVTNSMTYS